MISICSPSSNNITLNTTKENNSSVSRYQLENKIFTLSISKDINEIKNQWDALAPDDNLFLKSDYLNVLHRCHPSNLDFRYALIYSGNEAIGICYLQLFQINFGDSFNRNKSEKPKSLFQKLSAPLRNCIFNKGVYNVLICGNMLLTGKHGYYIADKNIDESLSIDLVRQSVDIVQKVLETEGNKKFQVQLFKDYPCKDDNTVVDEYLLKAAYHSYSIQPAMYMRLPGHWSNFDDYLEEMQSKYRVRAKRAAKKGEELNKKELSLEEIKFYNPQIYTLYQNIAKNVGFNAFTLDPEYFYELKLQLGDRFKLYGIFLDDKLVAFYTAIFNAEELEAHFLGIDYDANKEYHIYLNILYSLIDLAISNRMKMIDFARTALEIKSSVGAVPCDLNMYMRHRNRLSSHVMKFIFDNLTPEEEWQPRSPFKNMSIVK